MILVISVCLCAKFSKLLLGDWLNVMVFGLILARVLLTRSQVPKKLAAELELEYLAMPKARTQAILNVCEVHDFGAMNFDHMSSEELMGNL